MDRLDKVLANQGFGSRKEVKLLVKQGNVRVDGVLAKDSGMQVDPDKSNITIFDKQLNFRKYVYLMMNKPDGVISATEDDYDSTVIDLLEGQYSNFNLFPVGRLDKDTVGLLILTNDGELNHRLISPKWHVDKTYYAKIDKPVDDSDIKKFKEGITLDDGYVCMEAVLKILKSTGEGSEILLTIQEGKFHQVKRMFESIDKKVVFLKRISFGPISLDEGLEYGEWRELTAYEINLLKKL